MGRLFDLCRESVSALDVAERYGLAVNRSGKALCPWHDDHKPSLSFKGKRCYCFACNNGGGSVDLAAVLLGVPILEAAQIINRDFGLQSDDVAAKRPVLSPIGETPAQQRARLKEEENQEYGRWCEMERVATAVLARYTPEMAENSPEFQTALKALTEAQTALDSEKWRR